MAKSSINFAKASSGGLKHNDRTEKKEPEYLLPVEHRGKNEVNVSAKVAAKKIQNLYSVSKEKYKKYFGQKLQAKSYIWEAVINLNKEHKMDDLEKLTRAIEQETGFKAVQIAIHRDEGHINERNIAEKNLHAHVTFFTLDQNTGQQLYRKSMTAKQKEGQPNIKPMNRVRLSELQTLTAKELGMERGKVSVIEEAEKLWVKPQKASKRLEHKEFKRFKQELAKQKDLKAEMSELKSQLQDQGAKRLEYAKLETENKQLKNLIKTKDLSNLELTKRLNALKDDLSPNATPSMPNTDKNDLKAISDAVKRESAPIGMYEVGSLEREAERTETFGSAFLLKKFYESKGEIKKNGLFKKSITVVFKHDDLESFYQDLISHDTKRTNQFKKSMQLFRKVEKPLQEFYKTLKEKLSPKKEVKISQNREHSKSQGMGM